MYSLFSKLEMQRIIKIKCHHKTYFYTWCHFPEKISLRIFPAIVLQVFILCWSWRTFSNLLKYMCIKMLSKQKGCRLNFLQKYVKSEIHTCLMYRSKLVCICTSSNHLNFRIHICWKTFFNKKSKWISIRYSIFA